eukprot:scaffold654209_cov62-Prasinocladus_malaysianus.AAC.1
MGQTSGRAEAGMYNSQQEMLAAPMQAAIYCVGMHSAACFVADMLMPPAYVPHEKRIRLCDRRVIMTVWLAYENITDNQGRYSRAKP